MRFAAAAAVVAGAAVASAGYAAEEPESTVYSTDYVTVTSCAPYVTDCPAESTVTSSTLYPWTTSTVWDTTTYTTKSSGYEVVVTETVAVSTTICPVTEKEAYPTNPGSWAPYPTSSEASEETDYPTWPETTGSYGAWPTGSAIPWTTAAPACPTYSVKTISTSVTTVIPTVIYETVSIPCPTKSYVAPSGTYTPPTYTAGAANVGRNVVLAAAAGLAAAVLA